MSSFTQIVKRSTWEWSKAHAQELLVLLSLLIKKALISIPKESVQLVHADMIHGHAHTRTLADGCAIIQVFWYGHV